jgi:hypothetical protein
LTVTPVVDSLKLLRQHFTKRLHGSGPGYGNRSGQFPAVAALSPSSSLLLPQPSQPAAPASKIPVKTILPKFFSTNNPPFVQRYFSSFTAYQPIVNCHHGSIKINCSNCKFCVKKHPAVYH